jgi:ribonuclease P protein component
MLPKARRIPRQCFKPLLTSKSFFNSQYLTIRTAPTIGGTCVAVSVSKKISKKAVVRNKIRRRLYTVMQTLLPTLPSSLYYIITKHGIEKLQQEDLRIELQKLIRVIGV